MMMMLLIFINRFQQIDKKEYLEREFEIIF